MVARWWRWCWSSCSGSSCSSWWSCWWWCSGSSCSSSNWSSWTWALCSSSCGEPTRPVFSTAAVVPQRGRRHRARSSHTPSQRRRRTPLRRRNAGVSPQTMRPRTPAAAELGQTRYGGDGDSRRNRTRRPGAARVHALRRSPHAGAARFLCVFCAIGVTNVSVRGGVLTVWDRSRGEGCRLLRNVATA